MAGSANKQSRCKATTQFLELNPNPVLSLDYQGAVTYVNATGRARFPGLAKMALGHPILAGLDQIMSDLKDDGEKLVVFVREVSHGGITYDQQILSIPDEATIYLYMTDITERKLAQDALRQAHARLEERVEQRTSELAEANSCLKAEIVRREQAQQDLQKAKETADAANRAKSEFLAHMSHEIRTPLNGVMGMTDVLLRTSLDYQQCRYAQLIKSSGESLTTIISDILDFSKIEAGKLELESIDFNLWILVEDVMVMLAQRASEKGLELACYIDPRVPPLVRGDSARLRQILINLVSNGIKFTTSGEITLLVTIEAAPESQASVRFAVTDSGVGIPSDRMERLFKPFSQADASTTRRFGGTGLGLAICKRLAELMGGAIGAESEPGRGSTFWFTVRVEKQAQHEPVPRCATTDLRVLAVDDNATLRKFFQQQMVSWGIDAGTAPDGQEALRILREAIAEGKPYRVALIDSQMPGLTAFELAKMIKADAVVGRTVLLILLSIQDDIDSAQLRATGFAGFITKPVRQSQLLEVIKTAIATESGSAAQPGEMKQESISGARPERAVAQNARILVAEDNEVNQLVAAEILKTFGYRYDIVNNGRSATEAALSGRYDLILMDCEMPEMDGFEATRAIRENEKGCGAGGAPHIPIVALTANAVKGDREQCLHAGMDAYASKPFNSTELIQTIQDLLLRPASASGTTQNEQSPASSTTGAAEDVGRPAKPDFNATPIEVFAPSWMDDDCADPSDSVETERPAFDLDNLVHRFMGNVAVARSIIERFEQEALKDLDTITSSVSQGDSERTARAAHALKGAASAISAETLRQIAEELEQMGRSRALFGAQGQLARLRIEVHRCVAQISRARMQLANPAAR